jgi:GT2 family glycosyltransferase
MIATIIFNTPELIKPLKAQIPEIKIIDCGSTIPFESDLRYEDNLYWVGNWHRILIETDAKFVWMLNSDLSRLNVNMCLSMLHYLIMNDGFIITPSFNSPHKQFDTFNHDLYKSLVVKTNWVDMTCPIIDVAKYRELGGFDLRFKGYFADIDLCYRAREKGFKMYVDNRFKVEHIGGYTVQKEAKHEQANMEDNQILIEKYGKSWHELI